MTDDGVIDDPEAGVLDVGYRRPGVARVGVLAAIPLLGTAYTGFAAFGPASAFAAVGFVGCAAAARRCSAAPVRHHHSLGRNPVKISR
jgi:hypothetical protein